MTPNPGPSDRVHDLRATLETITHGLVEGLPDRLLDAEPRLAELTARLTAAVDDPVELPAQDHIHAVRPTWRRCQHLGSMIPSFRTKLDTLACPPAASR